MTEHSEKFQRVKDYYDTGKWNAQMVRNAVGRWITEEEAEIILGMNSEPNLNDSGD